MHVPHRLFIQATLFMVTAGTLPAQATLQGTVSFLNSGSRPAAGVDISAFGASTVATTESGMFILKFPNKKPGDKVKIIVGSKDRNGVTLELVNDKVIEQIRIPSRPEDDFVEILVCKKGQRDEAMLRFYGIIVKTVNEATDKRLREIDEKLDAVKLDAETIVSLQNEKEKLALERDSALAQAEEQALYIANLNLDKASKLVLEAVTELQNAQDINAAILILDNEILYSTYQKARDKKQKAKTEIKQVIEGFELKIRLLEPQFRNNEIEVCCQKIKTICEEEQFEIPTLTKCNLWAVVFPSSNNSYRLSPVHLSGGYLAGDKIEDFSLLNVDGNKISLDENQNIHGYIVIFMSNHDPYSMLYEDRIIQLHYKYAPKGFPVIAINPNSPLIVPEDSFEEMQKRAKEKKYPFVYLKDEEQSVYPKFGATRTPQVFVIDKDLIVRYTGSIDDNPETPNQVKNHYAENAVDALLRGEKPDIDFTRVIGSAVKKKPN